jgi:hypothetical protein
LFHLSAATELFLWGSWSNLYGSLDKTANPCYAWRVSKKGRHKMDSAEKMNQIKRQIESNIGSGFHDSMTIVNLDEFEVMEIWPAKNYATFCKTFWFHVSDGAIQYDMLFTLN